MGDVEKVVEKEEKVVEKEEKSENEKDGSGEKSDKVETKVVENEDQKQVKKESENESSEQKHEKKESEENFESKGHENWNKLNKLNEHIETHFQNHDPYTEIGASVVNGAGIRKSELAKHAGTARKSELTTTEEQGEKPGHFIVKVQGKDFKDRLIGYLFDQLSKEEQRNKEKNKE